jgi:hypothetical protein
LQKGKKLFLFYSYVSMFLFFIASLFFTLVHVLDFISLWTCFECLGQLLLSPMSEEALANTQAGLRKECEVIRLSIILLIGPSKFVQLTFLCIFYSTSVSIDR